MSIARTIALALFATLAVPAPASEAAPTVAELTKDRAAAAERAYRLVSTSLRSGIATTEAACVWSVRWLDAALESTPKAAKQLLADHQKRMTDLEAEVQKLVASGQMRTLDAETVAYFRIEAELWSARGKR
jgi:hypothetical protein